MLGIDVNEIVPTITDLKQRLLVSTYLEGLPHAEAQQKLFRPYVADLANLVTSACSLHMHVWPCALKVVLLLVGPDALLRRPRRPINV